MSGNATTAEQEPNNVLLLLLRIFAPGFLFLHCSGQLMAFWQAARIIGPEAFPVLLTNAAIPMTFFIGAVMLLIGFKARFAAIAMIVLMVGTTVLALMLHGSVGSGALTAGQRLAVVLALSHLFMYGAGTPSIDAWTGSRRAARAAS